MGVPRPLLGSELDDNGDVQFGVEESAATASDGTEGTSVTGSFVPPAVAAGRSGDSAGESGGARSAAGGTFAAGQTLYYAVAGVDEAGNEGGLSFLVRARAVSRWQQRDADGAELRAGDGVVPCVSRGHAGAVVSDRVGAAR